MDTADASTCWGPRGFIRQSLAAVLLMMEGGQSRVSDYFFPLPPALFRQQSSIVACTRT